MAWAPPWVWPAASFVIVLMQAMNPFLTTLVSNAVFVRRVYRSASDYRQTINVLDCLSTMHALRLGMELWEGRNVPMLLICRQAFVASEVSILGIRGDASVTITIWRFRWAAPVLDDPPPKQPPTGEIIVVLQRQSNKDDESDHLSSVVEKVYPAELPRHVVDEASVVARLMADKFTARKGDAIVFVLHGAPGTGKSTALRMLARELNAQLYADYNPTTAADNLRALTSDYTSNDEVLVVGYEECDVSMEKIKFRDVREPEGYRLDANDKASWNALFDMVKRRSNVVMVLTTNKTREQLLALCDEHGSMLRKGRIDGHFTLTPGQKPVFEEPTDFTGQ